MHDRDESVARLLRFRQSLEQLIEDVLPGPADSLAAGGPPAPLDVFLRPDVVEIHVELPGARARDLEISALGQRLVIEGVRPGERAEAGSYLCLERPIGRFRRVVELPVVADTRRATGHLRDGVLVVRIPRIQDRRGTPRPVPIDETPDR
jgi:HSP20 family protein